MNNSSTISLQNDEKYLIHDKICLKHNNNSEVQVYTIWYIMFYDSI